MTISKVVLEQAFDKMERVFKKNIKETIYLTPEELQQFYGGSESAWESFLDRPDIKTYIESKLAKLTEIEARKALKRMSEGNFSSQELQSLKELINNSKLLNQKANQRPKVILTYMPKKQTKGGVPLG